MPFTRPSQRTDEFGSPGAYAMVLVRRRFGLSAAYTAGGLAASLATAFLLLNNYLVPAVIGVIAAVLMFLAARGSWLDVQRALVGARSEKRVAKALRRCGADVVVHGAVLGERSGDLDHAVIGPWLVAVETKTGYGVVQVDGQGKLWAGRRRIPKYPTDQVLGQSRLLSRAVGSQAAAVVCVVDMENAPFVHDGVTVCSVADLPAVVASMPAVIGNADAHRLAVKVAATER